MFLQTRPCLKTPFHQSLNYFNKPGAPALPVACWAKRKSWGNSGSSWELPRLPLGLDLAFRAPEVCGHPCMLLLHLVLQRPRSAGQCLEAPNYVNSGQIYRCSNPSLRTPHLCRQAMGSLIWVPSTSLWSQHCPRHPRAGAGAAGFSKGCWLTT